MLRERTESPGSRARHRNCSIRGTSGEASFVNYYYLACIWFGVMGQCSLALEIYQTSRAYGWMDYGGRYAIYEHGVYTLAFQSTRIARAAAVLRRYGVRLISRHPPTRHALKQTNHSFLFAAPTFVPFILVSYIMIPNIPALITKNTTLESQRPGAKVE